jgi:hypothetical protein
MENNAINFSAMATSENTINIPSRALLAPVYE